MVPASLPSAIFENSASQILGIKPGLAYVEITYECNIIEGLMMCLSIADNILTTQRNIMKKENTPQKFSQMKSGFSYSDFVLVPEPPWDTKPVLVKLPLHYPRNLFIVLLLHNNRLILKITIH